MASAVYAICSLLVFLSATSAVDVSSDKEYDVELEDEVDIIESMEENDHQVLRNELLDVIKDVNVDDEGRESDGNSLSQMIEEFYEDLAKRSLKTRVTNLLRKIMKKHSVTSSSSKTGKCSSFQSTHILRTECSEVTTFLGNVTACLIKCNKGQHLAHVIPHYELCGAPTKWRWTYQLRGQKKAGEKCLKGAGKTVPKTCATANCIATAAYYMDKIDYTMDPCQDFYEYSCGRWMKETKFPTGSNGRYLTYTNIRTRVVKNMAKLLREPVIGSNIDPVNKAKIAYQSCMNTRLINARDETPLLEFLQGDLAWPVIENNWDAADFDLESTLATLRGRYHNNILFTIRVAKSGGKHILQTWKGRTALPTRYYLERRYINRKDAYFSLMVDVAKMLGADERRAYQEMKDVLAFETRISELKLTDIDFLTEKTISDMMFDIPGIDWLTLFKKMISSYPISSSTTLEVWNVAYLRDLVRLVSDTDKRVVQNYMVWRIVKHRIRDLGHRFQARYLKYKRSMYGSHSLAPRWKTCAKFLIGSLQGPTGKLFVDNYFSLGKKKAAETMFHNIRDGFIHLLQTEVNWMDEKTKAYAKEKALAIKSLIGYNPSIYKNETYLKQQLKNLKVRKTDYFGNVLRILTEISQNEFKELGETYNVSTRAFTTRPTMVNAFYDPRHNTIVLPAGEMQYPFYWGDAFPRMFQYGAIGTILGHEITHGFDNVGSRRDKYGRLKNWWSANSLKEFHKRTKCIADQYSNYFWPIARENLDGTKTLGENIADNGGIRESYQGYQFWLQSQNITGEAIEPATGLTNNQMFFVGFANVRCAKYSHLAADHTIASNVHSPGRYRVIGSLQNFDKFSEAFHCKANSGMNPKKKCIIW